MENDGKRDIWEAFLEKLLAFKTVVENALKYAQVMTREIPVILDQPVDFYGENEAEGYFEVIAENISDYRWQRQRKGLTEWTNLTHSPGADTNKVLFDVSTDRAKYNYRCKLTGIDESVIYTKSVTVYVIGG